MTFDTKAAFEITTEDGHIYRIWASGRTEGFTGVKLINNRIPLLMSERFAEGLREREPIE